MLSGVDAVSQREMETLTNYCVVSDVKKPLHIEADNLSYDEEIEECIESASGMLVALAAAKNLTIPATVPVTIKDACRYIAAYLFKGPPRSPAAEKPLFMEVGLQFFEAWCGSYSPPTLQSEDGST